MTERGMITELSGEIDHHSAARLRAQIDAELLSVKPACLILDFGKVGFMDSSGIGLVMGRYRNISEWGGKIVLQNLPEHLKKVMKIAGIQKIASIEETSKGAEENEIG